MVAEELSAADAFFDAVASDPELQSALDALLADPAAPLIAVLPAWADAPPEAAVLLDVNGRNAQRLDEVLAEVGWPGLRAVGADGADAAWLLAEHADRHNEARASWLPLLADAVQAGDADPRHLATLTDRAGVVDDRPQTYGTIVELDEAGGPVFDVPVADPAGLDERRGLIGLVPLAADLPYLANGDLVPFGPDRRDVPVNQWPIVLEGHLSIEAALEGGSRPVHRIWARRPGDRRLGRLRALARERGVLIEQVDEAEINAVAHGRSHGGTLALVGPRIEQTIDRLLDEVGEGSLVVMLDGIEDPFNFGQAVRALYAAGVDGLVVRRSWETATAVVARASAGSTELMPTGRASGADEAAEACRGRGMRVACAVADAEAEPLDQADLTGGVFVLVGGERRGVTRSFVERADVRLRIPYGRERAPALGAATAAAVIGFEALRQRRQR